MQMKKLFKSLGVLSLVVLAACGRGSSMFVEQHEITAGGFNGLTIGMSREQVLGVAKTLGAHVISARPCMKFTISAGTANSLPALGELEGVRITDRQNHFQDIYFTDGKVSRITHTPGTDLLPGSAVGDNIDHVRKIFSAGESMDGLAITPIVDLQNGGVLTIDDGSSLNANPLGSHSCWQFEINSVAPAGAVYEIEFGTGGLKRILYRRPRIRSE
jgi:hypothetical protein